jgi:hypothetical protein
MNEGSAVSLRSQDRYARSIVELAVSLSLAVSLHLQHRFARGTAVRKYLSPELEIPNKTEARSPKLEIAKAKPDLLAS